MNAPINIATRVLRSLALSISIAAIAILASPLCLSVLSIHGEPLPAQAADKRAPVLAYSYIWYTPDSWNRAKSDLPLLGAYSSDDESVMRQQVQWAKAAGIDGFIVSWKNAEPLSRRLDQLVRIAHEESFKLSINYESLDFNRNPLSVDQVKSDLTYFTDTYAKNTVFNLFGKPLVIWAGTWKFDRAQVDAVSHPLRGRINLLSSEKQPETYDAIADLMDGNAYYWSSVDPASFPGYLDKLQRMSDLVHEHSGIWIAPVAPGFDARHLGGQRQVDREEGAMLSTQFTTALASHPDAVGLISWNEFSENSHIEPSCLLGDEYLALVGQLLGAQPPHVTITCDDDAFAQARAGTDAGAPVSTPQPTITAPLASAFDWDSSAPGGRVDPKSRVGTIVLLAPLATILIMSVLVVIWRSVRILGPMPTVDDNLAPMQRPAPETHESRRP